MVIFVVAKEMAIIVVKETAIRTLTKGIIANVIQEMVVNLDLEYLPFILEIVVVNNQVKVKVIGVFSIMVTFHAFCHDTGKGLKISPYYSICVNLDQNIHQ